MMINRDILYIEDNFHNRRIVRKILERKNFNLLEAEDGITGYQMIQDIKPYIVLLDISLPGMDGIEIAQRVKSDGATRHVVLIALTASAMAGDRERFLAAGCDDYLSKPFKAFDLIEIVEKHYNEAWAFRADQQTFEEPTLVPEPAEIMRVEPKAPAQPMQVVVESVVENQENIPVEDAQVEAEAVADAQEVASLVEESEAMVEVPVETPVEEEPVEVETVVELQEETPAVEKLIETQAAIEVQAETPVEEAPTEVEVVVDVQEVVLPVEEPEAAVKIQAEIPIDEFLANVEADIDEQEKPSSEEKLAEIEVVAEILEEPPAEVEPVGDLRKALEAVAEVQEEPLVEETKVYEEPVNAWLPEAEVLENEPTQESEPPGFIPDTAELVLPPDFELEAQEEPVIAEVGQEKTSPAAEKVEKVLKELELAEAKSNNHKHKEEVASDDSKSEKPNSKDEIFNNVFGMINSETIKPLSPNGSSDKR